MLKRESTIWLVSIWHEWRLLYRKVTVLMSDADWRFNWLGLPVAADSLNSLGHELDILANVLVAGPEVVVVAEE